MDIFDIDYYSDLEAVWSFLSSVAGPLIGIIIGALLAGYYSLRATQDLLKGQKVFQDEERKVKSSALLSSLHHELASVWQLYMNGIGVEIEKVPKEGQETAFRINYPITSDYFPIYHANAGDIGYITNVELRNKIVMIYTVATALIDSYKMNNQLLKENIEWRLQWYKASESNKAVITECENQYKHSEFVINDYGAKLRKSHFNCKALAFDLFKELDAVK